jgi:hypothetical protein
MGRDDQGDLAARADEDDVVQTARGLRYHIGSPRHAGGRGIFAAIEHRPLMAQLQDITIGLDNLIGITGSQHHQARNGA